MQFGYSKTFTNVRPHFPQIVVPPFSLRFNQFLNVGVTILYGRLPVNTLLSSRTWKCFQ
uniref:Uncharacterized protein n=1 Tax=Arundo donax TaxID=35708 RepID=A0A0A9FIF1_ARUDO